MLCLKQPLVLFFISAVAQYAMRENHDITWDEAKVIDGNDK